MQTTHESDDALVAAATAGDEDAFNTLVRRHRRELHVHAYRMLGNFEEAEDVIQETFLRAWRHREDFTGGPGYRAWLYRITTNASLDAIRRSKRTLQSAHSYADVPWLQPYPDRLLDEMAPPEEQPDAVVVARETIELAFLAAIQLLPPKQRACLILRDVIGWSARETADALELTEAAANSALQRARATLQQHRPDRGAFKPVRPTDEDLELLRRFIDAHERADVDAAVAAMREDIRITMPPLPMCYDGMAAFLPGLRDAFGAGSPGDWRLVPTFANRMPTAASYLRAHGDTEFRAFKLDVIRVEDGLVAEVTTFGPALFPAFGLPATLPSPDETVAG